MQKKEKLYFKENSSFVDSLENILKSAKLDGFKEIRLYEAVSYKGSYKWCREIGESVERDVCKKSKCTMYQSESGRGTCNHRGNLYVRGKLKSFNVE